MFFPMARHCNINRILNLWHELCFIASVNKYDRWKIKILYFLPAGNFKNFWHNVKLYLHFKQYTSWKLSRAFYNGFLFPWYKYITRRMCIQLDLLKKYAIYVQLLICYHKFAMWQCSTCWVWQTKRTHRFDLQI